MQKLEKNGNGLILVRGPILAMGHQILSLFSRPGYAPVVYIK